MMKIGTLVGMAINRDLTNFGLYNPISGYTSQTTNGRKMKLSTPDSSLHANHIQ